MTTERDFEKLLNGLLEYETIEDDAVVEQVDTFEDAGVMTQNRGLVVKTTDGSEFRITIVQSKQGALHPETWTRQADRHNEVAS